MLTRSQQNRIRNVIRKVHEWKLAESLAPVERAIQDWRAGQRPVFDIDDEIHQHQMRAKRYWGLYANTAASSHEIAYILKEAFDLGLIDEKEHNELLAIWRQPRRK